ncbi:hypothetical protein KCP73_12285 [Salmonella enterica subsp. enterica]|nr:hypothetical protein KCP73_12285 [Salmonella enterica subsp. enterica]
MRKRWRARRTGCFTIVVVATASNPLRCSIWRHVPRLRNGRILPRPRRMR